MKKVFMIIGLMSLLILISGCTEDEQKREEPTHQYDDEKDYVMTFKTNGGYPIEKIEFNHGEVISIPEPTRSNHTFLGWYTNMSLTNKFNDTIPNRSLTLYAKWATSQGLEYSRLDDETCAVVGYIGTHHVVMIPREHSGCLITSIEQQAFKGNTIVQEVLFEDGSAIQSIGKEAFKDSIIRSINIPSSVHFIGEGAFRSTFFLKHFSFEEGILITEIAPLSFFQSGIMSITIPKTVERIGYQSFANSMLEYFLFEEDSNLKTICQEVFSNTNIMQIDIPPLVEMIFPNTFKHTKRLVSINVSDENQRFSSLNGVLYNHDQTILIHYPFAQSMYFTVPYFVREIGEEAFAHTFIKTINFEENSQLERISKGAFESSRLESITIPKGVTTILDGAFLMTFHLEEVIFEEESSLKQIGNNAFHSSGIRQMILPEGVENIGVYAFYRSNLLSINIPKKVERIEQSKFEGAFFLKEVVYESE